MTEPADILKANLEANRELQLQVGQRIYVAERFGFYGYILVFPYTVVSVGKDKMFAITDEGRMILHDLETAKIFRTKEEADAEAERMISTLKK